MAQNFSGDEGTSFQPLLDSGASTPLPNPQDLTLVRRVSVPTQASLIAPLTFEIRVSAATTYQTPATEAHNASCRNLTHVQSSWSVLDNCSVILSKVCSCLCTYGCECVCMCALVCGAQRSAPESTSGCSWELSTLPLRQYLSLKCGAH